MCSLLGDTKKLKARKRPGGGQQHAANLVHWQRSQYRPESILADVAQWFEVGCVDGHGGDLHAGACANNDTRKMPRSLDAPKAPHSDVQHACIVADAQLETLLTRTEPL